MASGDTLVVFTPHEMQPPATNYPTFVTRNQHLLLAFDAITQETAYFASIMPRNYGGGNITVAIDWTSSTLGGTILTGGWDVAFERMADAGDDMDADSFATAQTVTAALVPANEGIPKRSIVTCTAGAAGTDNIAAGDSFRLRVRRDVANDTATDDMLIMAIELREA